LPFPIRQYRLKVMFAANESSSGSGLRHALAGLQAGVAGALAMLACLMIGSIWDRRSIWLVPNLLATTFFGTDVYRNQFALTSWSGVALIVAVYGFLGMIWGCIWGEARTQWFGLYGAIAGLSVYFVVFRFLLRHANPLVPLYAPDRQLEVGHLFWGLFLARSSKYSRRIAEASVEPVARETDHELRSGEVIR
jgi:hypothetical protein